MISLISGRMLRTILGRETAEDLMLPRGLAFKVSNSTPNPRRSITYRLIGTVSTKCELAHQKGYSGCVKYAVQTGFRRNFSLVYMASTMSPRSILSGLPF